MKQPQFIFMARNIGLSPTQDLNGGTLVELRPQIRISHRAGDRMLITFVEDKDRFIIPSQDKLEEIYRMHLGNENLVMLLKEWCEKNLERPAAGPRKN